MDHHHHQHHHHQQQQQHHYLQQQQVHHHQPHHLHHQHQNQNQSNQNQNQQSSGVSASVDVTDRFPQWSLQETKELLMIRADLDQTFMETKRNKPLWEVIANRMKEKGFNRSPEQCKCKWKNLVTRYKGCETMEAETVRQQFPFYNELQAIFTSRMQRMLWAEAEGAGGSGLSRKKSAGAMLSSDEEDDDNNNNEFSEGEQKGNITGTGGGVRKKLKKMKSIGIGSGGNNNAHNLREILEDFMKQQAEMEAQWREAFEARESERRAKELEWRQAMKALENERVMMERSWREREEQRRVREEARAEKRDALITALLNKLRREDL